MCFRLTSSFLTRRDSCEQTQVLLNDYKVQSRCGLILPSMWNKGMLLRSYLSLFFFLSSSTLFPDLYFHEVSQDAKIIKPSVRVKSVLSFS